MRGIFEATVKEEFERYCNKRGQCRDTKKLTVVEILTMIVCGSTCIHSEPKNINNLLATPYNHITRKKIMFRDIS